MGPILRRWTQAWKITNKRSHNQLKFSKNPNNKKTWTGTTLRTFWKTSMKTTIKILCKVRFQTLSTHDLLECLHRQRITFHINKNQGSCTGTMRRTLNKIWNKRMISSRQRCWYVVWMSLVILIIRKSVMVMMIRVKMVKMVKVVIMIETMMISINNDNHD